MPSRLSSSRSGAPCRRATKYTRVAARDQTTMSPSANQNDEVASDPNRKTLARRPWTTQRATKAASDRKLKPEKGLRSGQGPARLRTLLKDNRGTGHCWLLARYVNCCTRDMQEVMLRTLQFCNRLVNGRPVQAAGPSWQIATQSRCGEGHAGGGSR